MSDNDCHLASTWIPSACSCFAAVHPSSYMGRKRQEKNRDAARKSRRKQTERADELHEVRNIHSLVLVLPFFLTPSHSDFLSPFQSPHTHTHTHTHCVNSGVCVSCVI
uniref:BZIP domain-containing protein n=1 Tax=Sander lucioperca TaxID=283035 RepID=A0A8C9ZGX4_SANLU